MCWLLLGCILTMSLLVVAEFVLLLPLDFPALLRRDASRRTGSSVWTSGYNGAQDLTAIGRAAVPCASSHTYDGCNVPKFIPPSDLEMPPGMRQQSTVSWLHHQADAGGISCCAISDTYAFIYIKLAKSASSTVLVSFLRPAICPLRAGEEPAIAHYYTNDTAFSPACTARQFEPTDSDCMHCHTIPRWKWLHYFVFTVVRNPIMRALSSYHYCKKPEAGVPFSQWCVNPFAGGGVCGSMAGEPDVHLAAQTPWFCGSRGGCIVDYVAHVESLSGDMDAVVTQINKGRTPGVPEMPLFTATSHAINVRNTLREAEVSLFAHPDNQHCMEALHLWYASDVELLGYPLNSTIGKAGIEVS